MEKQNLIDEIDWQIANLQKQLASLKEKRLLIQGFEVSK